MCACKTCKYAVPVAFIKEMRAAGYYGSCHRYPPHRKIIDDDGTFESYNNIFEDDWCGEWCAETKEGANTAGNRHSTAF
jgi:hypothetical protein